MYEYSVPCLMGVESLAADELSFRGFDNVHAENGRVLFSGDERAGARANILLRCGERVLLRLATFEAPTFDALFEGTKAIPWEEWIGREDAFPVKGYALHSLLHSVPDCQSIVKKAVVERLKSVYGGTWLAETGARRQIQFSILNDRAELYIDLSGAPLYKRGYKLEQTEASLRETLAAALVKLIRWRGREPLWDPLCGSGTIAVEAAMAALNIAPGVHRNFDAEYWSDSWKNAFAEERQSALGAEKREKLPLCASDIDPAAIRLTEENARRAGVREYMEIRVANVMKEPWQEREGVLLSDPPYGVRLMDRRQAEELTQKLGQALRGSRVKAYFLSADEGFERHFARNADKRRKLYNGMIRCNFYMYFRSGTL
ncbi:MAG: class I SAM-dependent RNA methyltransferase [Clostridiaceae bacterium]|nr:class I SAM-dependent RNA methyltransferase [Clostridiaceae bacterium]